MTRPRKQTVDYFPHYCRHGKTMMILEQKYGNNGYAFWFKLLEMLGDSDGHFVDLNDPINEEFLTSKTRLTMQDCHEILTLLAKLKAICPDLWHQKIIWSDNFLQNISDVYRNRVSEIPAKPPILRKKQSINGVSCVRNPHRRGEESKGENTLAQNPLSDDNGFDAFWKIYPKKIGKKDALKAWKKTKDKPPTPKILSSLSQQIKSDQWNKDNGQFIPNPATWINQGRWDDVHSIQLPQLNSNKPIRKPCPCGSGKWEDKCQCSLQAPKA